MTRRDFYKSLQTLIAESNDNLDEPTKELLRIAFVFTVYPAEIRQRIAAEISQVVERWAKRMRDGLDQAAEMEDAEWFLNFEWPEDFD